MALFGFGKKKEEEKKAPACCCGKPAGVTTSIKVLGAGCSSTRMPGPP